jgi:paxillin
MGKKWHAHHFVCARCTKGFPDGKYFEKNDKPYCNTCFAEMGTDCKSCGKAITSNGISAMGSQFHKDCFGCQVCKKPFGPNFYQHEGLPFCEVHYLEKMGIPICGGCNQPISQGQFLQVMGKKWHPQHFVCSMCTSPLKPDYKTKDNKPYCPGCFSGINF